ncbi:MAG: transposase family protein [Flavobacteriales bacterium]|nr:transposase family protein [Flavobacteriales bacterium]
MFQTVSAIISGCDSWTEIELFGETKKEWLEDYVHINCNDNSLSYNRL